MAVRRVLACFFFLAACGDARPPAAESATTTAAASTDPSDDDSDADEAPLPAAKACVPGASQECKIFWRSLEDDVQHCRTTSQVCTADGKGWTPCGDVDGGAPAVIE